MSDKLIAVVCIETDTEGFLYHSYSLPGPGLRYRA